MATVRELLLAAADLPGDSARRDAEIILGHCLQQSRAWLYTWPERQVTAKVAARYLALLKQRRAGHPVAHLTGRREFWTLELAVDNRTLIPRPETETLVAWALELALAPAARVLDLGTGSGAIALALAQERPQWQFTAVDASAAALAVARDNGERLCPGRIAFIQSDWYAGLANQRFELIVSNPPYIAPQDPHLERGDVRFEPRSALVAGASGLGDLAIIAAQAGAHLQPGGYLLLEHGHRQGEAVRQLLVQHGFSDIQTRRDLAGHERITGGCRGAQ